MPLRPHVQRTAELQVLPRPPRGPGQAADQAGTVAVPWPSRGHPVAVPWLGLSGSCGIDEGNDQEGRVRLDLRLRSSGVPGAWECWAGA